MLYKPNFCCQCGEKIDRIEWKIFTSRRFCEYCEAQYSFQDRLPKIFAVIALAFGFLGVGSYLKNDSKTLNVTKASKAAEQRPLASIDKKENGQGQTGPDLKKPDLAQEKPATGDKTASNEVTSVNGITDKKVFAESSPKEAQEQLFTCGAQTKKGTPCSRIVKVNERCWQHKGQPAMLPKEKLVVAK